MSKESLHNLKKGKASALTELNVARSEVIHYGGGGGTYKQSH